MIALAHIDYADVLEYCRSAGVVCNFNLFKPFRIEHACVLPEPKKFFDALIDLFELRDKKVTGWDWPMRQSPAGSSGSSRRTNAAPPNRDW
jgi:hypothetical protein